MLTIPVACVQRNAAELSEPSPAWPTTTLASSVMAVATDGAPLKEPRFWKPFVCVHRNALRGPVGKSLLPTMVLPSPLMPKPREKPVAPLPEPRSTIPPAWVHLNACCVVPLLKSEKPATISRLSLTSVAFEKALALPGSSVPRMTGLPAAGFQTVACSGPTPSLEFVPTMSESITWLDPKVPTAFGAWGAIGRAKHIPSPRAGAGNSTELTIFPFPLYLAAA